ncbi:MULTISPECIES: DUF4358 domain-containing protein [unclassified Ruminococcus]|uniref:DUF4358 domain-containing protein n=1 Tax=unclassified Ruminococcus TaxID=2608920 RepID=UPI00210DA8C0|nr:MULTISPECIES: DUF4358 domain-containing protein [unclassified Ruminococcus]
MKIKTISKTLVILMIAALTALSVCACGGSDGGKTPAVADIAQAIIDKYPLSSAMSQVTGEDKIKNVYGFDAADYSEIAAYVNNSGTEQDEIVIVKASSSDKVDAIKEKLQNRMTAKMNSTKNYLPEQYEMISKCEVASKGDYVRMFISPNAEDMVNIFNAQFE